MNPQIYLIILTKHEQYSILTVVANSPDQALNQIEVTNGWKVESVRKC